MKIIKLKAGLGNQMFQYAFGIYLKSLCEDEKIKYDISYYNNDVFKKYLESGILRLSASLDFAGRDEAKKILIFKNNFLPKTFLYRLVCFLEKTFNKSYFYEKNRAHIDVSKKLSYKYYDGYWQSWKYLEPIKDFLFESFTPRNALSLKTKTAIANYSSVESVFVGIRKGDYTSTNQARNHFGTCSFDYYKQAFSYIKNTIKQPVFVVFSDDIEWVKKNYRFEELCSNTDKIIFRNDEDVFDNFEELFVMSSCKHAIISNSTFNFWGAWLIKNKNKIVIAPKQWFKDGSPIDIIPDYWIKL